MHDTTQSGLTRPAVSTGQSDELTQTRAPQALTRRSGTPQRRHTTDHPASEHQRPQPRVQRLWRSTTLSNSASSLRCRLRTETNSTLILICPTLHASPVGFFLTCSTAAWSTWGVLRTASSSASMAKRQPPSSNACISASRGQERTEMHRSERRAGRGEAGRAQRGRGAPEMGRGRED